MVFCDFIRPGMDPTIYELAKNMGVVKKVLSESLEDSCGALRRQLSALEGETRNQIEAEHRHFSSTCDTLDRKLNEKYDDLAQKSMVACSDLDRKLQSETRACTEAARAGQRLETRLALSSRATQMIR